MNTKHIDVRGYRVAVARKWYWGSVGIRLRYNEISIDIKNIDLPVVILSAYDITTFGNHAVIPDCYYKSYKKMWKTQFRLSRFYLKYPSCIINGLRVYASKQDLPFYVTAVSNLPELKKILYGYNASFPSIIMAKGSKLSFYKDGTFLQNILSRLYLSDEQNVEIAKALINFAENIQRQSVKSETDKKAF